MVGAAEPAGTSLHRVNRSLTAGLALGALNAVVAIATFAIVEALIPDEFGWFAYAPLNEVAVDDPRFPWHYVVVPLALVVANVLALPVLVRRAINR